MYLGDNLPFLYFIMFYSVLTGMVCYNYIPPSATPQFLHKLPGADLSASILNYILATSYIILML